MQHIPSCSTVCEFINLMESIWDGDPNGLYATHHNAIVCARQLGLTKTAPSSRDCIKGYIYEFADKTRVFIARDGSMVDETRPRLLTGH